MTTSFIPFASPHAAFARRKQEIMRAVERSFDSGYYILGAEVESFEKIFAAYLGVKHATGCASGTDALELALRAFGVGPGTAVFTVSHTAVATVAAIERSGGVPVLVDIAPDTYTMSASSLEAAIEHVLASHPGLVPAVVIPVHIYGHPCDMDAIMSVAQKYPLLVLEDCAQAHGARYKNKITGSLGQAAAFSCYPTKNLGALGDAGIVATNDTRLAEEMSALRQYGWKERYISAVPGINSRLDPVQAAVLSVQLKYLDEDNAARRAIAARYDNELAGCGLVLPMTAEWAEPVFHLYVVRCEKRGAFMEFMRGRNIGTAVHYPQPVHMQPAYKERIITSPGGLPVTEEIAQQLVSLPMFPQLDEPSLASICSAIHEWSKAGA